MATRIVSSPGTFYEETIMCSQGRYNSPSEDTSADLWRNPSGKRSRSRRVGHLLRGRPKSSLGCCSDNTGGINHSFAFWHSVGHAQERSAGCIWSQWICWHRVRSSCAIARLVPEFMISTLIKVLVLNLKSKFESRHVSSFACRGLPYSASHHSFLKDTEIWSHVAGLFTTSKATQAKYMTCSLHRLCIESHSRRVQVSLFTEARRYLG